MSSLRKTILGDDVECMVYFDFQPYEMPEKDYPGCDASADLTAVLVDNKDSKDILDCLNASTIERIEQEILESLGEPT